MVSAESQTQTCQSILMAVLLIGSLLLTGCACCGPRYFEDTERAVSYQPMGQQQPSATYTKELERRLSRSER